MASIPRDGPGRAAGAWSTSTAGPWPGRRTLQREILAAYDAYEFHRVYQILHNFCVVDLGAFYLDVIKDRLYTTPRASRARRSAQTAMYHVGEAMVRWLAPVLSFTAEEIWKAMPGPRDVTVFTATWHRFPESAAPRVDWNLLLRVRETASRALETLRAAGRIGSGLDARVRIYAEPAVAARAGHAGRRTALRVHHLGRIRASGRANGRTTRSPASDFWVASEPADDGKCVRCWHRRPEVGTVAGHPGLCGRCASQRGRSRREPGCLPDDRCDGKAGCGRLA